MVLVKRFMTRLFLEVVALTGNNRAYELFMYVCMLGVRIFLSPSHNAEREHFGSFSFCKCVVEREIALFVSREGLLTFVGTFNKLCAVFFGCSYNGATTTTSSFISLETEECI